MSWITAATFATRVGCSRSNITQGVNNGRIAKYNVRRDGKNLYINTNAIADYDATRKNTLPAMFWSETTKIKEELTTEQITDNLNDYLGDTWPAPPWSAEQVSTLLVCLEMAKEAASEAAQSRPRDQAWQAI